MKARLQRTDLHVLELAAPRVRNAHRASAHRKAIWDDILPPTPDDIWQANLDRVVAALGR